MLPITFKASEAFTYERLICLGRNFHQRNAVSVHMAVVLVRALMLFNAGWLRCGGATADTQL